jgi:hypothetical protein
MLSIDCTWAQIEVGLHDLRQLSIRLILASAVAVAEIERGYGTQSVPVSVYSLCTMHHTLYLLQ